MTSLSNPSPLSEHFREDAAVDFCHSGASPIPDLPCAIVDDLQHALCAIGYAQLRRIGISYHDGCVVLQGRVPTYFLKQLAQSVASSRPGVQVVDNEIEVVCPR